MGVNEGVRVADVVAVLLGVPERVAVADTLDVGVIDDVMVELLLRVTLDVGDEDEVREEEADREGVLDGLGVCEPVRVLLEVIVSESVAVDVDDGVAEFCGACACGCISRGMIESDDERLSNAGGRGAANA